MTPFEAFTMYLAIKSHFTSDYDYIKYNGKMRISKQTFDKRKDQMFFMKLAKHENPLDLLVSNFVVDPNAWIRSLVFSTEADKIYKDYVKRKNSLTYNFKNDINALSKDLKSELSVIDNSHPPLLQKYLNKKISMESLIILLDITNGFALWDKKMENDIVWKDLSHSLQKYKSFLKYDQTIFKKMLFEYAKSV